MKVVDLSLPIDNDCMTCGTPWHQKVEVSRMGTLETVGRITSKMTLGSHSGTHMDAPLHFIDGGRSIDEIDLEIACGPVTVVDLTHIGKGGVVELSDISDVSVSMRMLFRFDWWKNWQTDDYYREFPYFSQEAVKHLIDNGMKLIALDTPSPDTGNAIGSLDDDSPNHKLLLGEGVIIIEYLTNTSELKSDSDYSIFALPLRICGIDGCPSRVIAIEEE